MKPLVELMADFGSNMVDKSTFVMSILVSTSKARAALVEEGGIPVLVEIIEVGSQRHKEIAVVILLQICDVPSVSMGLTTVVIPDDWPGFFPHAIVEELAGHGAIVHTFARNEYELNNYLKGWVDEGFEITGSVCDVSLQHDREKLIKEVSCFKGLGG
ncbi:hypothetical protein L2E82_47033 [Cichorium intybus]|uniref:Uncharacterized protein n=1 Tax=Cichorium intybus TaxID=13427 RepID=A0ACB8YVH8_CICIN|nr:hypothetical protein L2E82_47033 [Cichorium intybus]